MHLQPLIGDLAWQHAAGIPANTFTPRESETVGSDPVIEALVSSAVMVASAFRMRDEAGLVTALRALTTAVVRMERAAEA
jgi:hypothetical protein